MLVAKTVWLGSLRLPDAASWSQVVALLVGRGMAEHEAETLVKYHGSEGPRGFYIGPGIPPDA